MLNNKRNYFYIHSLIFLVLLYTINKFIFLNKILFSCYLLSLTS